MVEWVVKGAKRGQKERFPSVVPMSFPREVYLRSVVCVLEVCGGVWRCVDQSAGPVRITVAPVSQRCVWRVYSGCGVVGLRGSWRELARSLHCDGGTQGGGWGPQ